MLPSESEAKVARLLTSQEVGELSRLRDQPSVVGYVLMAPDGDIIEQSGVWDEVAPVLANIFDLADRLGEEIGEDDGCAAVTIESATHEITGVLLSSARAVIVKRKPHRTEEGLRSVR